MNLGKPDMSQPVPGHDGLRFVAWHGGGHTTLKIGKRHIAPVGATQRLLPRETLCGRMWSRKNEVTPNDYWTNGDCRVCFAALDRARSDVLPS